MPTIILLILKNLLKQAICKPAKKRFFFCKNAKNVKYYPNPAINAIATILKTSRCDSKPLAAIP
jgi:hypothetical protein